MKSSTLTLLALVALVAGSAAGAVTSLLARPRSAERSAPVANDPAPSGPSLAARLDELEAQNAALRARLAELELRPAVEPRVPVIAEGALVAREDFEALRAEVERLASGADAERPLRPDALEAEVAEALQTIREQERFEAVRASQEKRLARLDQDVLKLEEHLGLDRYQSDRMRTILLEQYQREAEVRRLWEEGAGDEVLGEHKRGAAETFRTQLAGVLSEEQLESFWQAAAQRGGK